MYQCAAQSSAPCVLTTIVFCSWWLVCSQMVDVGVGSSEPTAHRTAAAAASAPVLSIRVAVVDTACCSGRHSACLVVGCIDRVAVVNTCAWASVRLGGQHGPCCARGLQVDLPAAVPHCAVLASGQAWSHSLHVDLALLHVDLRPFVGLGRRRVLRVEGLRNAPLPCCYACRWGWAGTHPGQHPGTGVCVHCRPNNVGSALVQSSLG